LRLVVTFQRPLTDKFHGGSVHAKYIVSELEKEHTLEAVVPMDEGGNAHGSSGDHLLSSIKLLTKFHLDFISYVVRGTRCSKLKAVDGFAVIDLYTCILPLLLAKVMNRKVWYFAFDDITSVYKIPSNLKMKGGRLAGIVLPALEKILLEHASDVFVPSPSLAGKFSERLGKQKLIHYFPHVMNCVAVDPESVRQWKCDLGLTDKIAAIFLGNCRNPVQRRAALFVINKVAVDAEARQLNLNFIVAGLGTETLHPKTKNVKILGPVQDVSPLLSACDIGLAPMDSPGGVSNKILDYRRHGLTVVATPEAWGDGTDREILITPLLSFPEALFRVIAGLSQERHT